MVRWRESTLQAAATHPCCRERRPRRRQPAVRACTRGCAPAKHCRVRRPASEYDASAKSGHYLRGEEEGRALQHRLAGLELGAVLSQKLNHVRVALQGEKQQSREKPAKSLVSVRPGRVTEAKEKGVQRRRRRAAESCRMRWQPVQETHRSKSAVRSTAKQAEVNVLPWGQPLPRGARG